MLGRRTWMLGWAAAGALAGPLRAEQAPGPRVLTVRWADDPPFSFRRASGPLAGVLVDLHEQLLTRLGCRIAWRELPFARALIELEAGRLDLLPAAFDRPERRAFAQFSQLGIVSRNLLYVRQGDTARAQGLALAQLVAGGWKLGVQPSVVYGPAYSELLTHPTLATQLTRVPSRQALWRMLERGRVDAVPADEATASLELERLGLAGKVAPLELVLSGEPAPTAFSRRSVEAAFVARFDAELRALHTDGRWEALRRRYGAFQLLRADPAAPAR